MISKGVNIFFVFLQYMSELLADMTLHIPEAVKQSRGIIIAFSGGADSLALLKLLTDYRAMRMSKCGHAGELSVHDGTLNISALHCNFHLRGAESNLDMEFCKNAAGRMGIDIHIHEFPETAEESKSSGESIEMTCRRLRYNLFKEFTDKGYFIALGHHKDDNRETMFINMLRGCGLKGLTGIKPLDTERKLWRPLLIVPKRKIIEYLVSEGEQWRTDSSNLIADVMRNKLRLNILPAIMQDFPEGTEGIDRTIGNLNSDYDLLRERLDELMKQVWDKDKDVINLSTLRSLTSVPERVLLEILKAKGFNADQCRNILNVDSRRGWKKFSTSSHTVYTDGEMVIAKPEKECDIAKPVEAPTLPEIAEATKELTIETHRGASVTDLSKLVNKEDLGKTVLIINKSKLPEGSGTGKWKWRMIKDGDVIEPYGMKGKKLVKDILTDMHASPIKKSEARVLEDPEGKIIWLAPWRTSKHYTLGKSITDIYILRVQ